MIGSRRINSYNRIRMHGQCGNKTRASYAPTKSGRCSYWYCAKRTVCKDARHSTRALTLSRTHVHTESTCAHSLPFASVDRVPYAPYQHIAAFLQWCVHKCTYSIALTLALTSSHIRES